MKNSLPSSEFSEHEFLTLRGFGPIEAKRIISENALFVTIWDRHPVSPGHALVIVKRPVSRFAELKVEEMTGLMQCIDWCIRHLQATLKPPPDGFNIGLNDGPAAGQTIEQLHVHVIPRYQGDVSDPRGGVRWVLPDKANYLMNLKETKRQQKRYRRMRVTKEYVWIRWEAYGPSRRGLSLKIPMAEFQRDWVRLPNRVVERRAGGLVDGKIHLAQCHIYNHCVCGDR
jgi:diadenosine tetraphosphate (Ap4A) HIT family hydrolase